MRAIFNKFHFQGNRTALTHIVLTNEPRLCFNCTISRLYTIYLALCPEPFAITDTGTCVTDTFLRFSKGFDYATFRVLSLPSVWKELSGHFLRVALLFSSPPFFRELCTHRSVSLINYVATSTDLLSSLRDLASL